MKKFFTNLKNRFRNLVPRRYKLWYHPYPEYRCLTQLESDIKKLINKLKFDDLNKETFSDEKIQLKIEKEKFNYQSQNKRTQKYYSELCGNLNNQTESLNDEIAIIGKYLNGDLLGVLEETEELKKEGDDVKTDNKVINLTGGRSISHKKEINNYHLKDSTVEQEESSTRDQQMYTKTIT